VSSDSDVERKKYRRLPVPLQPYFTKDIDNDELKFMDSECY